MGVPLGLMVYFFALAVFSGLLEVLGLILPSGVILPPLLVNTINFGLVAIVLSVAFAVCGAAYFTRWAIQQGYRVFAWVQLPLMLLALAAMLALTLIYHKPPLPFAGQ